MIVAIALVTTLVLLSTAVVVRCVRRQSISAETFTQDTLISAGVGIALGLVLYPTLWIMREFVEHDSKFTANMLSKYDPNSIMISMVLGAFISTALTAFEYHKRVLRTEDTRATHKPTVPRDEGRGETPDGPGSEADSA